MRMAAHGAQWMVGVMRHLALIDLVHALVDLIHDPEGADRHPLRMPTHIAPELAQSPPTTCLLM